MISSLRSIDKLLLKSYPSFNYCRCLFSSNPENLFTSRSHTCGELNSKHVGKKVTLCGWLQFQRMNKFAILRDGYGTVQIIVPDERLDIMSKLGKSSLESVITIQGEVKRRPKSQINEKMSTGDVEVIASSYEILNMAENELPFSIRNYNKAKESLRMKYRYLDLRFPEMQRNLRLRSKVIFDMRKHLIDKGFVEVETPTLFKRTPGGAQEFIVPTEFPGEFYALTQSPQQLKQLLMVGGIDRYFQVARCYRNEGARPDRQPEFSQLDIEMSFTDHEGMMNLVEGLVNDVWPEEELGSLSTTPYPRITLNEAMNLYGTDKPDISSDIKIQQLNPEVLLCSKLTDFHPRILVFPKSPNVVTNNMKKWIDDMKKKLFSKTRLYYWTIPSNSDQLKKMFDKSKVDIDHCKFMSSLNLEPDDLVFLGCGSSENEVLQLLGRIRTEIIKNLPSEKKWNVIWVTDFPLFEESEDGSLKSVHHPFTQPHPDDAHLLSSDPLKVRGLHYDLVLNGWEIAGGSVRIHSSSLQKNILDMLGISADSLKHMLKALDSGAPPHAGIAFGLDRILSIMVNAPTIRDVIAFPKTSEGRDVMCSAPSPVTDEELDLYKISVNKSNDSMKLSDKN